VFLFQTTHAYSKVEIVANLKDAIDSRNIANVAFWQQKARDSNVALTANDCKVLGLAFNEAGMAGG